MIFKSSIVQQNQRDENREIFAPTKVQTTDLQLAIWRDKHSTTGVPENSQH